VRQDSRGRPLARGSSINLGRGCATHREPAAVGRTTDELPGRVVVTAAAVAAAAAATAAISYGVRALLFWEKPRVRVPREKANPSRH